LSDFWNLNNKVIPSLKCYAVKNNSNAKYNVNEHLKRKPFTKAVDVKRYFFDLQKVNTTK